MKTKTAQKPTNEMTDKELREYCEELCKDPSRVMTIIRDRDQILRERNGAWREIGNLKRQKNGFINSLVHNTEELNKG